MATSTTKKRRASSTKTRRTTTAKPRAAKGRGRGDAGRESSRRPKPPARTETRDAAVKAATGRTWEEWRRTLDADGAMDMDHKAIARHVHDAYGVGEWWCQTVTVGYERLTGRRARGQMKDGWRTSASRTIGASPQRVFAAWNDAAERARWLPGAGMTVRKATPHKSMRITWDRDGSALEVMFYPKGAGRCQVSVQHGKLADEPAMARAKTFWGERLDALRALLER